MTPFSILMIGHFIGDFLFQTSWIATYKATKWLTLIVHVLIYTVTITMLDLLTFHQLSIGGILFIFISHYLIDWTSLAGWWMNTVLQTSPKSFPWLKIVIDQIFHFIVLAIALYL